MSDSELGCIGTLADCFKSGEIKRFSDHEQISEKEFADMLDAIHENLASTPRMGYDLGRSSYDTPFYNGDSIIWPNGGNGDQVVCIGSICSHQTAVNYVAQGMYSAHTGQSLEDASDLANDWNTIWHLGSSGASDEELFWTTYGYDYYLAHYSK